jgi:hypothetical protein
MAILLWSIFYFMGATDGVASSIVTIVQFDSKRRKKNISVVVLITFPEEVKLIFGRHDYLLNFNIFGSSPSCGSHIELKCITLFSRSLV